MAEPYGYDVVFLYHYYYNLLFIFIQGADFIDGSNRDGNGHGTHVAGQILIGDGPFHCMSFVGTVIGDNYGLARKATAIAVRVINDNGSGTIAYVLTIDCGSPFIAHTIPVT